MRKILLIMLCLTSIYATGQSYKYSPIWGNYEYKDSIKFTRLKNNITHDSVLTTDTSGKLILMALSEGGIVPPFLKSQQIGFGSATDTLIGSKRLNYQDQYAFISADFDTSNSYRAWDIGSNAFDLYNIAPDSSSTTPIVQFQGYPGNNEFTFYGTSVDGTTDSLLFQIANEGELKLPYYYNTDTTIFPWTDASGNLVLRKIYPFINNDNLDIVLGRGNTSGKSIFQYGDNNTDHEILDTVQREYIALGLQDGFEQGGYIEIGDTNTVGSSIKPNVALYFPDAVAVHTKSSSSSGFLRKLRYPLSSLTADIYNYLAVGVTINGITTYADDSGRVDISSLITGGTVTNFTAGTLSPLFTTSVATSTTTPALSFSLNSQTSKYVFWNSTSGSTTPSFAALDTSAITVNGGIHTRDYNDARYALVAGDVSSVFGRTGAVVAMSGDYNTSLVTESGNLYFTDARAIASTLTGYTSGAGTISSSDNILQAIQKLNGNIGAKLDTSGSYINGIVLNTPNVLYATPVTYTTSSHVATGTLSLNTQTAYKLFGTGSSTATPTFLSNIDSNWVLGLHGEPYYNTKYTLKTATPRILASDTVSSLSGAASIDSLIAPVSGFYNVNAMVHVLSGTLDVMNLMVSYKDETNNIVSVNLRTGITTSVGYRPGTISPIWVHAGTQILISTSLTTGTGSIGYNAAGYIELIK